MFLEPISHENDLISISDGNTPFGFHRFIYYIYTGVSTTYEATWHLLGRRGTRGSPQPEISKKMKFRHGDHLENS